MKQRALLEANMLEWEAQYDKIEADEILDMELHK